MDVEIKNIQDVFPETRYLNPSFERSKFYEVPIEWIFSLGRTDLHEDRLNSILYLLTDEFKFRKVCREDPIDVELIGKKIFVCNGNHRAFMLMKYGWVLGYKTFPCRIIDYNMPNK